MNKWSPIDTLWSVYKYLEPQAYPIRDWLIHKPYGDALDIVTNAMRQVTNESN